MSAMARLRYNGPLMVMIALVAGPQLVQSLDMEYCATINTASTPRNSSTWQSNGLCYGFCNDQHFAFAVVQKKGCWCSNYIPYESAQTDIGKCNDPCPGWKYETCGGDGVYGYIELDVGPSGTLASPETTSTPESTSTTSSSSSTADKTSSTGTTAEADSATSLPPATSVKTVTADGSVSRITVTPTSIVTGQPKVSTSKLSPGATAGIAVGAIAGVAIIAGVGTFLYLQRKRRQREEEITSRSDSRFSGSAGIMGTPTTAMASIWDGENTSTGRRSSRLMPHDPRMDPFTTNIYNRFDNKSRESINTLQDNQDYSRKVLRTTNPDPPEE